MSCLFYGGPIVVAKMSPGIDSEDADSNSGHNWQLSYVTLD
jgi:hypothetical protein